MFQKPFMHKPLTTFALSALVGLTFAAPSAFAETAEEKGLAIITEADSRDDGYGDSMATMKMVLTNRHGDSSSRKMRMKTKEVPDKSLGDKALIVFDQPRDVKGTALLSFTKIIEPDDQWLYLPALKRVKRIASVNKSGPFVGSEFAFEDMASQEVGKYSYKYLRNEACGDMECFVVESYPRYEHSGYTKLIGWLDTTEYRTQKIDYYDRKDTLLKTLTMTDYKQYHGKFWRPHNLHMQNHQSGKTSSIVWDDMKLQIGLEESDFTKNALKRSK
jgi:hypothetical protein